MVYMQLAKYLAISNQKGTGRGTTIGAAAPPPATISKFWLNFTQVMDFFYTFFAVRGLSSFLSINE